VSRLNSLILTAFGSAFLFGCGGGGSPSSTAGSGGGVIAAPAPTPAPTVAPAPAPTSAPAGSIIGTNMEEGYPQLNKIPTNFATAGLLSPSWGTGAIATPMPAGDNQGAFRFMCKPSHLAYDDPIVFPGQPGRSHLHMFFGNTLADGNSTYESLRTTGASTCNNALNRSSYWIPALANGRGQVIMPDGISIYYKRELSSDPMCKEGKGCIGLPRGLRFVFGRTMSGGERSHSWFTCDAPNVGGHHDTLVDAAKVCPIGAMVGAVVEAPRCWNGTELDSPDHRSHMAHTSYGADAKPHCPSTHPYLLPQLTIGVFWTVDETLDRSGDKSTSLQTWHFVSDRMEGMTPQVSGSTFHADWFGAWDDDVLNTWMTHCIEGHLSCTGGDIGNGKQLSYSPEFLASRPRLVSMPAKPKT
jgi:hypothetical protein